MTRIARAPWQRPTPALTLRGSSIDPKLRTLIRERAELPGCRGGVVNAVYVCNPGAPRGLTPEQVAEPCTCRHERTHHWWGGGACGECSRCDYFRPRKTASDA